MADRRRRRSRVHGLVLAVPLIAVPLAHPSAQSRLRFEAWTVAPSLSVSATYDDNVFAVPADDPDRQSDVSIRISPQVSLIANTRRHAFSVSGGATIGRFLDRTDQNFADFNLGANGRWDVTRTFDITGSLSFAQSEQDQADPDRILVDEVAQQTTTINSFSGSIAASKRWQRSTATVSTDISRQTFEELEATVFDPGLGLTPVDTVDLNADRPRTRIANRARWRYTVTRRYNVFATATYTLTRFDENNQIIERGGLVNNIVDVREGDSQDFETLSVQFGNGFDFDQVVEGDVSIGVTRRFSDDEGDDDNLALSFNADLDWTLSPRTSLNVSGRQGFDPATGDAGGSALNTNLGLNLSYRLSPQISLGANADVSRRSRTGSDRTDNRIGAGLSASYNVNQYASLSARYSYEQRFSDEPEREFTRNRIILSVVGRY